MKKYLSIMIAAIVLMLSTSMVASAKDPIISPTPAPMYHVTYDLVKTESSNMTTVAKPDASYRTVVKPNAGYRIERVQIIMSGVDITDSVYNPETGVVYIPVITGDIEVIAKSVKGEPTTTSPSGTDPTDETEPSTNEEGSTVVPTEPTDTPGGDDNGGGNNSSTSPVTGDFVVLSVLLACALAGGSLFAYKKVKKSK